MRELEYSKHHRSGTWGLHPLLKYGSKDVVLIRCPNCGKTGILDHDVDDDGTVQPSVECPTKGCDFHEHVRLLGWTDRKRRRDE